MNGLFGADMYGPPAGYETPSFATPPFFPEDYMGGGGNNGGWVGVGLDNATQGQANSASGNRGFGDLTAAAQGFFGDRSFGDRAKGMAASALGGAAFGPLGAMLGSVFGARAIDAVESALSNALNSRASPTQAQPEIVEQSRVASEPAAADETGEADSYGAYGME